MGMQPPAQSSPHTVVVHRSHPRAAGPTIMTSISEQLQSLHQLQQNSLISEEDYNAKKKQLSGI